MDHGPRIAKHLVAVGSSFLSDDHRATCACGWEGSGTPDFQEALREATTHQDETKEVLP